MRKLLIAVALIFPSTAFAKHMDVIEVTLKDGCTLEKYMAITSDFNEWGKTVGYQAEVAVPVQSHKLMSIFWLGTSADAATFGKAWDTWRDAQADSKSTPAKLQARFNACGENNARRGYDVY